MKGGKISLIIPVYNNEKFLKRCIHSVIKQNYQNLEIICVDDGSTDESLKLLKELQKTDNRIVVISQENKGVSVARNKGISQSTGDYIMFVDSDDFLEPNACETLVKVMEKEKVDLVRANYQRVYEDGKKIINKNINCTIGTVLEKHQILDYIMPKLLNGEIRTYLWLLLIRSNLIKQNNIDFIEGIKMMQDKLFYMSLFFKIEKMIQIDNVIYNYYCNSDSTIMSKNKIFMRCEYILIVAEKIEDILKKNHANSTDKINMLMVNHFNMLNREIFYALANGYRSLEIYDFIQSLNKFDYYKKIMNEISAFDLKTDKRIMYFILKNNKKRLFQFWTKMIIILKKCKGN